MVERLNAALNDHDLEGALALLTDDHVFDSTTPPPDGRRYVGKEALRQAWAPMLANAATHFELEEEPIVAGDRVIQLWRYSWGDGHIRGVDLIRVRNGLVSETLSYVKG